LSARCAGAWQDSLGESGHLINEEGNMSAKTMTHAISPLIEVRYLALNDEKSLVKRVLGEGEPEAATGYPTESTAMWELTEVVPMKFNRLVVYDSNLFHTPHFHEDCFGETLETRRLTQNLYFNLRKDSMGKPETLTS